MQRRKLAFALAFSGLLLLGCSERTSSYPWIYDLDAEVNTNGKMIGYEFWAKW